MFVKCTPVSAKKTVIIQDGTNPKEFREFTKDIGIDHNFYSFDETEPEPYIY